MLAAAVFLCQREKSKVEECLVESSVTRTYNRKNGLETKGLFQRAGRSRKVLEEVGKASLAASPTPCESSRLHQDSWSLPKGVDYTQ